MARSIKRPGLKRYRPSLKALRMFYNHLCGINNVGINYISRHLSWGVKQKTG